MLPKQTHLEILIQALKVLLGTTSTLLVVVKHTSIESRYHRLFISLEDTQSERQSLLRSWGSQNALASRAVDRHHPNARSLETKSCRADQAT